jgi:hypothetical protein
MELYSCAFLGLSFAEAIATRLHHRLINKINYTKYRHPVEGRGWALPLETKPNPGLRRDDELAASNSL